jgi:nitrogen fixation NifU-like protein
MSLDSDDEDLYRAIILEHSSRPPHRGRLESPTHHDEGINPSCGDEIELFLRVKGGRIEEVTFDGVGCSICMASASMLTRALRGKTVEQAQELYGAFKTWITVRDPAPSPVDLDELEALGGVRNYPVRIKCALLAWETFSTAMRKNPPHLN